MLKQLFTKHNTQYEDEVINILRLMRSENVGIKTFLSLIKMFGNATTAIENIGDFARRGGKNIALNVYSKDDALREIDKLERAGAKFLTYIDKAYPQLLSYIDDFPPIVSYMGNVELLNKRVVAIVGARNASINGRVFAGKIAKFLVENDIVVASGLARGIDTAAHAASAPNTIAVVAGGIDYIYPSENTKLFKEIADGGLIIAELPIGAKPLAKHFPQRNRIISGVSLATVVVEASLNSGSLITARYAVEQGREVFAVPGFPLDPRAQGTNRLVKEGAYLIESPEDVLNNLPHLVDVKYRELSDGDDNSELHNLLLYEDVLNTSTRNLVIESLSSTATSIDEIARTLELPLPVIYTIIVELELAGRITRLPGNKVVLNFTE